MSEEASNHMVSSVTPLFKMCPVALQTEHRRFSLAIRSGRSHNAPLEMRKAAEHVVWSHSDLSMQCYTCGCITQKRQDYCRHICALVVSLVIVRGLMISQSRRVTHLAYEVIAPDSRNPDIGGMTAL
jgi:hypothetical protein